MAEDSVDCNHCKQLSQTLCLTKFGNEVDLEISVCGMFYFATSLSKMKKTKFGEECLVFQE